jgi:hypothetical protein
MAFAQLIPAGYAAFELGIAASEKSHKCYFFELNQIRMMAIGSDDYHGSEDIDYASEEE